MDSKKTMPVKRSAGMKKSRRFTATLGMAAILTAVIGVVAAAMLIDTREPSPANIGTEQALEEMAPAPAAATPKQAVASKTSPARATPATRPAANRPPTRPAANRTPANAPVASAAKAPVEKAPVETPAAVTMMGCVERDGDTFRLKDTDAPKSRSWKSGFLKKNSASIELVDEANRVSLTEHVGRRVSVSGVLVDREMQVGSLYRVAASCN